MLGILNPSPVFSRPTLAVVSIRVGGLPALLRAPESAIEKHPACAAAMSSSGLVPLPSSKRDLNEYGPSQAPEPIFIVPLPCIMSPSQTAVEDLAGILISFN